jgi:hypothetical protein
MNNEPVAWMQSKTTELLDGCECMQSVSFFKANDDFIPLYTHPAKTLTDEEIIAIANGCLVGATAWHNPDLDPIEFARAILKKAQE